MNFATLKTETLVRAGLPSTDGMAADAVLGSAVNAAVQRIGAEHDWPWLYDEDSDPTVAGTATLALPATAASVRWVAIGDDDLDRRGPSDLVRYVNETGIPRMWASNGTSITLSPTPDAVYTVKFGLTLVEPVLTGTDTPLLPSRFHDRIVVEAAIFLAARIQNPELLALLREERTRWQKAMDRAMVEGLTGLTPKVRHDWYL